MIAYHLLRGNLHKEPQLDGFQPSPTSPKKGRNLKYVVRGTKWILFLMCERFHAVLDESWSFGHLSAQPLWFALTDLSGTGLGAFPMRHPRRHQCSC